MAPTSRRQLYMKRYYADRRHQSCQCGTGDFGTSPIFVQISGKQLSCHYFYYVARRNVKHNGRSEKRGVLFAAGLVR